MQMETADDIPIFMEPESGQMTASKTQQDEKDRIIAELEEQKKLLAKELEEIKSTRIQKLESEIQHLRTKETEMNAQCTKAIEDIKAEYEEKYKTEEHQKKTEVETKVKRQDAVASGVLRGFQKNVETLKKNCEEKDATIAGLTKELEKVKEENQQKDLETGKHIEETKAEVEKLRHELGRQHLAEVSRKQKEYDQLLDIKKKEIELLRKQLHQVSAKLEHEKETPETVQRLTEELKEKDCKLNTVVTEIRALQDSYEKLVADHERLQHQYGQLTVELKMKKELSETSEFYSNSDPCNTTVMEPWVCAVPLTGNLTNECE